MLAAATLGAMGYEHVASVAEGFEGWVAGGRPVEAAIDPTDDPGRGARKGGEDHRDPDPEHPRALD